MDKLACKVWVALRCGNQKRETVVQSPPSGQRPMFGETFALNPMFTFFAVQTQLHFLTAANYENNLPPNVGLRPDGRLCTT